MYAIQNSYVTESQTLHIQYDGNQAHNNFANSLYYGDLYQNNGYNKSMYVNQFGAINYEHIKGSKKLSKNSSNIKSKKQKLKKFKKSKKNKKGKKRIYESKENK